MNLDELVEEILDIAREQPHSDAVIIIRDRIEKDIIKSATPSTEAQPVVRDNATMVAWQKAESQRLNTEAQKCVKCGHDKSNVDTEGRCSFGWAYHANCKDWCGCRCVFPTEAQPDDPEKQAREIVERWQRESEPPPLGINIEKELIEEIAAALRSRPGRRRSRHKATRKT